MTITAADEQSALSGSMLRLGRHFDIDGARDHRIRRKTTPLDYFKWRWRGVKCNETKTDGIVSYYQSREGYTGPDRFDLFVLAPGSSAQEVYYNINVR